MTSDHDNIRALAEAALEDDKRATPGPWQERSCIRDGWANVLTDPDNEAAEDDISKWVDPVRIAACDTRNECSPQQVANAAFIAAARTREPELARFALAVLDALDDVGSGAVAVAETLRGQGRDNGDVMLAHAGGAADAVAQIHAAIGRNMALAMALVEARAEAFRSLEKRRGG